MSPVRYELGFYIPEDGILYSHRRENLKSYISHAFMKKKDLVSRFGMLKQYFSWLVSGAQL
jgi:hypothetical protein